MQTQGRDLLKSKALLKRNADKGSIIEHKEFHQPACKQIQWEACRGTFALVPLLPPAVHSNDPSATLPHRLESAGVLMRYRLKGLRAGIAGSLRKEQVSAQNPLLGAA